MQDNPSHFSAHFPSSDEPQFASSRATSELWERRRRRRRTDWRLGGRAVGRWNSRMLAVAVIGGICAVLAGLALTRLVPGAPPILRSIVLCTGLAAVVIAAVVRARPAGLFRFAPRDVLWGIGLGCALRLAQGFLSGSEDAPFPSSPLLLRGRWSEWALAEALPSGLIGPVVEELFFRAVLLVAVYQASRRSIGTVAAALTASLVSTSAFVWLHASYGALALDVGVQLFLLGMCLSLMVVLTGRVWSAVIAHIVYNASFVMLVFAGARFSG